MAVGEAAERAGAIIAEQARAILEAAYAHAADIRRAAEDDAARTRAEAMRDTQPLRERMDGFAGPLGEHLAAVRSESDRLGSRLKAFREASYAQLTLDAASGADEPRIANLPPGAEVVDADVVEDDEPEAEAAEPEAAEADTAETEAVGPEAAEAEPEEPEDSAEPEEAGAEHAPGTGTCPACEGGGECPRCRGYGHKFFRRCRRCGGSGTCPTCGGDGSVTAAADPA